MTDDETKAQAEKVFSVVSQTLWAQKLYNEYTNAVIFGTSHPYIYKKATRWERFKWRMLAYKDRVRDAWKVLTGKAEIYEGQDD